MAEAEEFIRRFYSDNPETGDVEHRVRQVWGSIQDTGTYSHTPEELTYAARVAWRHSSRCVGRDKWRTLRVRDKRGISAPEMVANEVAQHLYEATNNGNIRSTITIFAPDTPERRGPRILNSQAIRYAGYQRQDGVLGDPMNLALTTLATRLGWEPLEKGSFDILPLVIQGPDGRLSVWNIPEDAVMEVAISHPDYSWFAELGLRWYAVPLICDMYLDAGGIRYPASPFNGWYQASTEVGVRDLGDVARYNVLPAVAKGMGLDTSRLDTFWLDRAAVELAVAAHHSFKMAGVMVTDHQSEARRFCRFAENEEAAGRPWSADWSWVNPPVSASTTPAFHRTYPDQVIKPGYFRHEDPFLSR
jgi:nitric-oxide synthase, bacterial